MNEDSSTWNPHAVELFEAIERNDLAAAQELLSRGADVNSLDPRCPSWFAASALVTAACLGYGDMARLLLANGADVDAQDSGGGTALIWACNGEHIDCARLLLAAGADPSVRNNLGYTAHSQTPERNEELIGLLKAHSGS